MTGRPPIAFWSRVEKSDEPDGCWLWTGPVNDKGYGVVWFEGRTWRAHQVAYMLAIGPIPEHESICHRCDVRNCCKPLHLFSASQAENVADMDRKGRRVSVQPPNETRERGDAHWTRRQPERVLRGERNGRAKLSDAQVEEIRYLYRSGSGLTLRAIGQAYGVSQSRVQQLVSSAP